MSFFLLRKNGCTHGCRIRLKKFLETPQGVVAVRHVARTSCTHMARGRGLMMKRLEAPCHCGSQWISTGWTCTSCYNTGMAWYFLLSVFFFLLSAFFFLHLASCRVVSCRVVSCRVVSCRPVPCRLVLFLWLYDNLHAGSTYITKQPNLVLAVSSAYVLTSRPVALHR